MIFEFRKYSSLWMITRKTSADTASRGETVRAMPTMSVLEIRLPMTGSSPQRKVRMMTVTV